MSAKKTVLVVADLKLVNLGDELIFNCLSQKLLGEGFEKVVKPSHKNIAGEQVEHFYFLNIFKMLLFLKRAELVIFGGGGILQNNKNLSNLSFFSIFAILAFIFRVPIEVRSVGVTPINSVLAQFLVRAICFRARYISVRDEGSKQNLYDVIASTKIVIEKDIALSYKANFNNVSQELHKLKSQRYVFVSLRPLLKKRSGISDEDFQKHFAECLRKLCTEKNYIPVMVALHSEKDIEYITDFVQRYQFDEAIVIDCPSPDDICFLLKHSQFAFCMRLHAAILAHVQETNFSALSYSQKIDNFMRSENISSRCFKVKNVASLYDDIQLFIE